MERKQQVAIPWHLRGTPFSFTRLSKRGKLYKTFKTVKALLGRTPRRESDELVITAMQWAGRANATLRDDEAFLKSTIALESIMLPTDKNELNYRLQIRTAHLLSKDKVGRQRIRDETKALYGVRSKIVHNGYYQVTHDERERIASMVRNVLVSLLFKAPLITFSKQGDLSEWLEEKTLS
jgi:hypothetical protein